MFLGEFLCVSSGLNSHRADSSAHPVGSSIFIITGFGFLSRLHGLSIDNLLEVEMVLADGRIVIVSEDENPGRSFIPSITLSI